jgi:hypothetical protein
MIKACKQVTISSLSFSPLQPIYVEVDPSLQHNFDMHVKGETIEAHISDKESAYQLSISVLYIINRGNISEVYFRKVSCVFVKLESSWQDL